MWFADKENQVESFNKTFGSSYLAREKVGTMLLTVIQKNLILLSENNIKWKSMQYPKFDIAHKNTDLYFCLQMIILLFMDYNLVMLTAS